MSIYAEIGKEIVSLRKEAGYTQETLAYDIGMSVSHLRLIEHGNANPTIHTLARLADAFGGRLVIYIWRPRA